MANFPTSVTVYTTRNPGQQIPSADWNSHGAEISAIEDGLINGTAPIHSSNNVLNALSVSSGSTLNTLSVTGNSTLASSITIGTQPYVFPSSQATAAQVLTAQSLSGSTARLEWRTPNLLLIAAGNGTDTNAAATTVVSASVNGLTANDELIVSYELETSSQQTANIIVYHVTDNVTLASISAGVALAANTQLMGQATVRQRNGNSTALATVAQGVTIGGSARVDASATVGVTTAWTGTFALGIQHGGVTAGGTFKWAWQFYKRAGQ